MVLKFRYRTSLILAVVLLVLAACGFIVAYTFKRFTGNAEDLARTMFREVSNQAEGLIRQHIQDAARTMDQVRSLSEAGLLSDDPLTLAAQFLAILNAHPEFTWVSYSSREGEFIGAYRASDGSRRINHSWFEGDKVRMQEFRVEPDGRRTLLQESRDHGYDPRTREFYKRAIEKRDAVWLPPYVFFGQNIPGITCAAPRGDRGVFTVDFDLNGLSRIVRAARIGATGTMFLHTPDGTLLAHPKLTLVEGASGELVKLSDVNDPVINRYAESRKDSFELGGETFLANSATVRVGDGLDILVGVAVPRSEFMGPAYETLTVSLSAAGIAVLIAVVVAMLLAGRVAEPLAETALDLDRLGRLHIDEMPPKRSRFEEIDSMQRSLSGLKAGLKSFARFVPQDLVRRLMASGRPVELGGETRVLTVFFSDIPDFTSTAEKMPPDELVAWLSRYFESVTRVIAGRQGTVDKFLGDGIMAFWGAPQEQADHAVQACRAALDLKKRASVDPSFRIRIGLATGRVVVGTLGTPERINYTAIGDTVNLASRLQGVNKIFGTRVLVDEGTVQAAQGKIIFRPVDFVAVKGKETPGTVYEPLCEAGDPGHERSMQIALLADKALAAYLSRDFDRAIEHAEQLLKLLPDDGPAQALLDRCRESGADEEGWTGIRRVEKL